MNNKNRLDFFDLPLKGLKRIKHKKILDERGYFSRLFCTRELMPTSWKTPIAQINKTNTVKKGTVRGMHFQRPPFSEIKIINCIKGSIWDVVVDLRKESSTYLDWHAEKITSKNNNSLLIPTGFAHGYQTLTNDVVMIYMHSIEYNNQLEDGINPRDPTLSITWPLEITNLSIRDQNHPNITKDFQGIIL